MSYHRDADHPLADTIISTTSLGQPSFGSGSLKPSEDTSVAHIQPASDILVLRLSESDVTFLQVDSSDCPGRELEIQVELPSLRTSIMTGPTRTSGREGPFAIKCDRHGDSLPELGAIRIPAPQLGLSRTSESYHHHPSHDDSGAVPKSKAQSGRSGSLVTRTRDAEVDLLRVSPSPSTAPAVKRIMIRRETTGSDWQSVFDVVKYDEEKRAVMVIKERGARTGDIMRPSS